MTSDTDEITDEQSQPPEAKLGSASEERARVLLVGLPRSGTTLVATLLAAQPGIVFLTDYFSSFREAQVRLQRTWTDTLDLTEKRIALALVRDQFLRARQLVLVKPDDFVTLDELHRAVLGELGSATTRTVGHKLLLPAEDLERVLEQTEIRCLLMVRDPRDAALSYFHRTGGGVEHYLDGWSTTVRAAHRLRHHPRLLSLRFEDLIADPGATVGRLGRWLGQELTRDVPQLRFSRSAAHGSLAWNENSAFQDVSSRFDKRPVGRWRSQPSSSLIRYAGWATRRELPLFGYEPSRADPLSRRERLEFASLRSLYRSERNLRRGLDQSTAWLRGHLPRLRPTNAKTEA